MTTIESYRICGPDIITTSPFLLREVRKTSSGEDLHELVGTLKNSS